MLSPNYQEGDRQPPSVSKNFTPVTAPPIPAVSYGGLGLDGASDGTSDEPDLRTAIATALQELNATMAKYTVATMHMKQVEDDVALCKNKAARIPSGTNGDFSAMARQAQRSLELAENRFKGQREVLDATQKENTEAGRKLTALILSGTRRLSATEGDRMKALEDRSQQHDSLLAAAKEESERMKKENEKVREENEVVKIESQTLKQDLEKMRNGYAGLLKTVEGNHVATREKQEAVGKEMDTLRKSMGKKSSAIRELKEKYRKLQDDTMEPFRACAAAEANQSLLGQALDKLKARVIANEKKPASQPTLIKDLAALDEKVEKLAKDYKSLDVHAEDSGLIYRAAEGTKKRDELQKKFTDMEDTMTAGLESLKQEIGSVQEEGKTHVTMIKDAEEVMKTTLSEFSGYCSQQDEHHDEIGRRLDALEEGNTQPRAHQQLEQDLRLASIEQRIEEVFKRTPGSLPDAEHNLQRLRLDLEAVQQTCRFLHDRYNNVTMQGIVASMAQHYDQHYGFGVFRMRLENHDKQLGDIHKTLQNWGKPFNTMNVNVINLQKSVASIAEIVKKLQDSAEPSTGNLNAMLPQISNLQDDWTVLVDRIAKLEGSDKRNANSLESFESHTDAYLTDIRSQISKLQEFIEDTEKRLDDLTTSVADCTKNDWLRERKIKDLSDAQADIVKSIWSDDLTACQKQLEKCQQQVTALYPNIAKIDDVQRDLNQTKDQIGSHMVTSDALDHKISSHLNNFQAHVQQRTEKTSALHNTTGDIRTPDINGLQDDIRNLQLALEEMKKRAKEPSSQTVNGSVIGTMTPPDRSQNNNPLASFTSIRPQGRSSTSQKPPQSMLNGTSSNLTRKSSAGGSGRDTSSLGQQAAYNATRRNAPSTIGGAGTSDRNDRTQHGSGTSFGQPTEPASARARPRTAKLKDTDNSKTSTMSPSVTNGHQTPLKSENTFIPPHAIAISSGPKAQSSTIVISDDDDDDEHLSHSSSTSKKHDRPPPPTEPRSEKKKRKPRELSPEL